MRSMSVILAALTMPSLAQAKDLGGRFGFGFNNQLGGVSALSARFGIPTGEEAINLHVEGVVGFDQNDQDTVTSRSFAGGRLLYGIVAEDNMNLFLGGGAGMLAGDDLETIRVEGIMEAQFFLFGLENLGFTTGWGIHVDTGDLSGAETTAGMALGAHYWF